MNYPNCSGPVYAEVRRRLAGGETNDSIRAALGERVKQTTLAVYLSAARKALALPPLFAVGGRALSLSEPVISLYRLEALERGTTFMTLLSTLLDVVARDGMVDSVLDGELPRKRKRR